MFIIGHAINNQQVIYYFPLLLELVFQREFREKFDLGEPNIPLKLASPPKDKKHRKRSHGDQAGEDGPVKKKRKKKKTDEEVKTEGEGSKKKKEKVRNTTQSFNCACIVMYCQTSHNQSSFNQSFIQSISQSINHLFTES